METNIKQLLEKQTIKSKQIMENGKKSTINERILELVEESGGPSEVARMMGVDPQIFYNFKNRTDSKPNSKTLERLFEVLPTANANYIYKGIGPKWLKSVEQGFDVRPVPSAHVLPTSTPAQEGEWKRRYQELDAKYAALEAKFDVLFDKYSNVMDRVMAKMAFSGSDSHTTASIGTYRNEQEVYGLVRYPSGANWNPVINRGENIFVNRLSVSAMQA